MKSNLIIITVAALAFASLPSCTSTGSFDPEAAKLIAEIGKDFAGIQEKKEERKYQRMEELQKAKRQPVDSTAPATPATGTPGTETPAPGIADPAQPPVPMTLSANSPEATSSTYER